MALEALEASALGDGVLSTTAGSLLYTVAAGKKVIIKSVTLVNATPGEVRVNLYIKRSGSNRYILPPRVLVLPYGEVEEDKVFVLEEGDTVLGDASAASAIHWSLSGAKTA